MRGTGQIPVYRETTDALSAFRAADRRRGARRVRRVLPRGHPHPRPRPVAHDRQDRRRARRPADQVPGDPGRPVGRQRTAAAVRRRSPTSFRARPTTCSRARPWTSRAFYDQEIEPDLLKEATEVIMAAVTRQLEEIRGEKAPETPYDPRRSGSSSGARETAGRQAPAAPSGAESTSGPRQARGADSK